MRGRGSSNGSGQARLGQIGLGQAVKTGWVGSGWFRSGQAGSVRVGSDVRCVVGVLDQMGHCNLMRFTNAILF